MPITPADVLRALELVKLPASGQALPASGRLTEIRIDGTKVMFAIAIDPTEARAMEGVRAAAESAVRGLPGITSVLVGLTADRPSGAAGREAPGPRAQAAAQRAPGLPGVRHVIAVASGKGGVGKSTTACNLAIALAQQGLRIGLLDADIFGPSMPKLFGLSGKPEIVEGRIMKPLEAYGVKVMSIGFLVDEETPMIWRGPMVMSALTQLLREVRWGELDVMVVDMPPGTGDAQLTMAQHTPLAGAVIVSTPQDLALIDARRGVAMFQKVNVPVIGIVENMSTFSCPNCGHVTHLFGHGGARREAERLGVPFLGELPLSLDVRERSDAGTPVVATAPAGSEAGFYRDLAARVSAALSGGDRRAPPRIVID
ncbi:Mrp/NBP35 family ATP-binding protein [Labrys wisconsinensis]|uniref:Iron-sulfur cluster carrier protein n=1 Tax=Labrys wisconsinensis TaxID=425677 RepID=A0ABU0J7E1_9HYPH|nr:Mrp/NBP35 family ATP-binding protein [Labrys wisconsinensis]MDQ0469456.1 ATP-binding protein involved in chromosome partitioning [Labrys wisconsinensis]